MKKIEPTKNVMPIAEPEAADHCEAIAPAVKHVAPTMNSTAIHQLRRSGRHQTPVRARSPGFRRAGALLRCARDCQRTSVPSGRRNTSVVTNGPGPSAETRSQPSGDLEIAAHASTLAPAPRRRILRNG